MRKKCKPFLTPPPPPPVCYFYKFKVKGTGSEDVKHNKLLLDNLVLASELRMSISKPLTLKTSALGPLYCGHFTLSTQ